jgi:hypothetical protein
MVHINFIQSVHLSKNTWLEKCGNKKNNIGGVFFGGIVRRHFCFARYGSILEIYNNDIGLYSVRRYDDKRET